MFAALTSLAACERATAPEALRTIDRLEGVLRDSAAAGGRVPRPWELRPESFASNWGVPYESPVDRLTVERDGQPTALFALAVERVFVRPSGLPEARPHDSRGLFAWRDFHSTEGLVIWGGSFPDSLKPQGVRMDTWGHNMFPWLVDARPSGELRQAAVGQADIEVLHTGGECELVAPPPIRDSTGIRCEAAVFRVTLQAETRVARAGQSYAPTDSVDGPVEWLPGRDRVAIAPQIIRGVRFTIDCERVEATELPDCDLPGTSRRVEAQ